MQYSGFFLIDYAIWGARVIDPIIEAVVIPPVLYVARSKERLLRPLPTDTGDAWKDESNRKLNATALVKIHDSDGWN